MRLYGHGEMLHSLVMTQQTSLWKQRIKTLMTYSAITWQLFEGLFIQETEHGFGAHLSVNVSQEKETPVGHTRQTDKPFMDAAKPITPSIKSTTRARDYTHVIGWCS